MEVTAIKCLRNIASHKASFKSLSVVSVFNNVLFIINNLWPPENSLFAVSKHSLQRIYVFCYWSFTVLWPIIYRSRWRWTPSNADMLWKRSIFKFFGENCFSWKYFWKILRSAYWSSINLAVYSTTVQFEKYWFEGGGVDHFEMLPKVFCVEFIHLFMV